MCEGARVVESAALPWQTSFSPRAARPERKRRTSCFASGSTGRERVSKSATSSAVLSSRRSTSVLLSRSTCRTVLRSSLTVVLLADLRGILQSPAPVQGRRVSSAQHSWRVDLKKTPGEATWIGDSPYTLTQTQTSLALITGLLTEEPKGGATSGSGSTLSIVLSQLSALSS